MAEDNKVDLGVHEEDAPVDKPGLQEELPEVPNERDQQGDSEEKVSPALATPEKRRSPSRKEREQREAKARAWEKTRE